MHMALLNPTIVCCRLLLSICGSKARGQIFDGILIFLSTISVTPGIVSKGGVVLLLLGEGWSWRLEHYMAKEDVGL